MDKYKKLISNTAILSVGTLASKVLVYLLLPLYTACLSPEQYSMADLITQTANLLLPILAVGMTDGIFRFAMDSSEESKRIRVFCVSFYMVTIGALVSFALLPLLNLFDFFNGYGILIILYVIMSNYHSCAAHFLRGCGKTKLFALQGIIGTALTIAFNLIFLLVFDMGVVGYVLATVCADALLAVFLFFKERLWRGLVPKNFDKALAKSMTRYSVPMIPTTIFWWITNVVDRYMITYYIGQHVNGLYAAAFKIPTLLILVSGIFNEAWQYSAVTDSNEEEQGSFFSNVFNSFQALIFLVSSCLILFAKVFCKILFNVAYSEAWQYMPLLIAATIFSSMVTFMSSVYVKNKRSKNSFYTAMLGAVSNTVMNFILIPKYGAQGAAIATCACYVLVYIVRAIDTQRYIKFNTRPVTIALNSLLIGIQCVTMLFEIKLWIPVGISCFIAITLLNFRPLLTCTKTVLKGILKRNQ